MVTTHVTVAALALSLVASPLALAPVATDQKTEKSIVIVKQKDGENRAWLGVVLGARIEEGKDKALKEGVEVLDVMKDSPAEKAGLQEGDLVTRFEGKAVEDPGDLSEAIRDRKPGDRVKIEVRRGGRTETLEATLAERKAEEFTFQIPGMDIPSLKFDGDPGALALQFALGKPRLGVRTMDLSAQLAEYFSTKEDEGILVTEVIPGSLAEKAGLQAGDVLLNWNGKAIADSEDVRRLARKAEKDETVRLGVLRRGTPMTFEVTFDTEPGPVGGPEMKLFQHEGGPVWIPHTSLEDTYSAVSKARDEAMKAYQEAMKARGETLEGTCCAAGKARDEAMKACQEAMKARGTAGRLSGCCRNRIPGPGEI